MRQTGSGTTGFKKAEAPKKLVASLSLLGDYSAHG